MFEILMMSEKWLPQPFLKERHFEIKVITSYIVSMMSLAKFCYMTQIILWMWACDQSLVTLAFV